MRPKNAVLLVGAALATTAALAVGVRAYSAYASWPSSPVTVYVNPGNADVTAAAATDALETGMSAWNTAGTSFRFQYGGTVSDTSTSYDGRNVVIFRNVSNGSALATTYSWWNGSNQLVDADIIFWDGGFTFFTGTSGCGVPTFGAYIEDVAAHELGHALGLNHSSFADATMYPTYSYCSQELRTLSADDIAGAKSLYRGSSPPSNTAPSVSIASPANGTSVAEGATVLFSGAASDSEDGTLTPALAWWSSLDGTLGSGGAFSRTLTAGSHTITASVTDSGGLTASKQISLTVNAVAPSGVSLVARGRREKGLQKVDLSWSGVTGSTTIDVYRDGSRVMITANDGAQTDPVNRKGSATYTYQICGAGTSVCSNVVSVVF